MNTEHKKLVRCTLLGILLVSVFGSLLHFAYGASGGNFLVGLVSPVNESTWEHMKLLFFPMLLYLLLALPRLKASYPCAVSALPSGILAGTFLIPILFYTYSGFLGFHNLILDIAVFLVSTAAGFLVFYRRTLNCRSKKYTLLLNLLLTILALLFFLFTCFPPSIGLFVSP
ncbi:DUF6512 family protein [Qiania dongpingensis]|uniref:Uncharacterized protein n=1 Tax=Qiania dongpingensis TaxID=2763669 RepID=A0A7G9G3I2_9FIRM|nr:DUF6512 family protein [Qiania dongpingensis]QNM05364.1 hypothetical protein H9Q78_13145 [Qiania dongpingensis]